MIYKSNNPVFNRLRNTNLEGTITYERATYKGIAAKTFFFTMMTILGAVIGIYTFSRNGVDMMASLPFVSVITLVSSLIAMLSPKAAKISGTIYCISEGILVGLISLIFEAIYPGVVIAGLLGTISVLFVVATFYLTGLVKVTRKFTRFLMIFALSIILCQVILLVLSVIDPSFNSIYDNFGVSLLVSLIMIFLATLYLFFDMENIRQVVEGHQPKELEWYASFGLVFTLIWLYIETLKLVSIFIDRN